jgi:glycosyltransferase involved in cell wall biosynthesis
MYKPVIRMLFMPRESFPTDRVRINALFGRELLSRGHEIDLAMQAEDEHVATGARDWFGRTLWVGPTDSGSGFLHRLHKHWLGFRSDWRALRFATKAKYDGVLVSDKFLIAAIATWFLPQRKIRLIYWLTFHIPEMHLQAARDGTARYPLLARIRGTLSGWLLYKWILARSDHVFVQSERMKDNICRHHINRTKVSPILTGFSYTDISPCSRHHPPATAAVVTLAYLGTLDTQRHLEMLIDMLARLLDSGMRAKLLLVGRGEMPRDELELIDHADALGVGSHLEITGFLPQPQALRRIALADICLSPIHRSPILDVGSPTKLIEYLALAMPVVVNDHPEQKQILQESRAGLCVPWGARHFARAVSWLMRRPAAERAAMGSRGRSWVEKNRTYARIADDVERTCISVLGSSTPQKPREVVCSGPA